MPRSSELAQVNVTAVFISFYYALNHWEETGAELSVKEWPAAIPPSSPELLYTPAQREDRSGSFKSLLECQSHG